MLCSHDDEKVTDDTLLIGGELPNRDVTTTPLNKRSVELQENNKPNVITCAEEIEKAFPLPDCQSINSSTKTEIGQLRRISFWYSNEHAASSKASHTNYIHFLDALSQSTTEPGHRPRIGILVGESSLLASAPELARHCDIILLIDCDPMLLHSLLIRMTSIQECQNLSDEDEFNQTNHEFMYSISNASVPKEQISWSIRNGSRRAKEGLNKYHPFSSEERLIKVKNSLRQLIVIPVFCNLFYEKHMLSLSQIIRSNGADINVMNLSNAMEYDKDFYPVQEFTFIDGRPVTHKWIKALPLKENTLCRFSAFDGKIPSQCLFWSPDNFFSALEKQARIRNVSDPETSIDQWLEHLKIAIKTIDKLHCLKSLKRVQGLLALATAEEVKEAYREKQNLYTIIDNNTSVDLETKAKIKQWIDITFTSFGNLD